MDVAIYAHGGLTDEDAAADTARAWVPHLYTHKIFPIFLMWETGAVDTLRNIFQDVIRGEAELTAAGGRWERFKERFSEWKDARLEGRRAVAGRQNMGRDEAERGGAHGARKTRAPCSYSACSKRCARSCRAFACT